MPRISIDQQTIEVAAGATVLDAARRLGVDIPTLCHHKGYPPQNSCLLCLVKVDGSPRLRPACSLPAAEGMVIESDSDEVRAARRTALELLLSDHAGDCIAPCQNNCPAHMDVPLMMRQIVGEEFEAAIRTVKAEIPLPAVLGRICPAPCEGGCRRKPGDAPVAVCLLKRFVADEDLSRDEPFVPACQAPSGRTVAVVGAGPAGLAAAYDLQLRGHACTLYDNNAQPGGALRYAIDRQVLPLDVLDGEIDIIRRLGAQFVMNWHMGVDGTLDELRRRHNAVLLAMGPVHGQAGELALATTSRGVSVNKRTFQTQRPDVFAAGGTLGRTRLAVRSVAQGKDAARCIDRYLRGDDPADAEQTVNVSMGPLAEQELAALMLEASPDDRLSPEGGLMRGFNRAEARAEAGRCLQCSCRGAGDCRIRALATQYGANPRRYPGARRRLSRVQRQGGVVFEPGKCISCGLCVAIVRQMGEPIGLSFVGRGFDVHLAVPGGAGIARGLGQAARACVEACPTAALRFASPEPLVPLTVGAQPIAGP